MAGRRPLALLAALAFALGVLPAASATTSPTPVSSKVNPVNASGAIKNTVFYYQGKTPLDTAHAAALRQTWGNPALVVTTPKPGSGETGEADAVAAIHKTGAKAYRYVQFFWAPGSGTYDGDGLNLGNVNISGWAFCTGASHTKAVGRKNADGTWYFIDANERAVRSKLLARLKQFKADGWDGVMFDRGEAATRYAATVSGNPIWYKKSTCTNSKYRSGVSFASAYVNMLGLANQAGLYTVVNNGKSPFDPVTPMRPSPGDRDCQLKHWGRCTFISDEWSKVNLVLNEMPAHPRDVSWRHDYLANQRAERNTAHGRRTIALITTASLGGLSNQTKPRVYFQWARIKLFNLSVAVNTGNDGCVGDSKSGVCNRKGIYPELVKSRFGRPLGTRPTAQNCSSRSTVHCIWVRRYGQGMSVANVSGSIRKPLIRTGLSSYKFVWDVYNRKWLAGGRKTKAVRIGMGPWTGRPLRFYSVKPSTNPN